MRCFQSMQNAYPGNYGHNDCVRCAWMERLDSLGGIALVDGSTQSNLHTIKLSVTRRAKYIATASFLVFLLSIMSKPIYSHSIALDEVKWNPIIRKKNDLVFDEFGNGRDLIVI